MKKYRKKRDNEQDEHLDETWLVPYADLLTVLLALFIVLFAFSNINQSKYEKLMESFKTDFTGKKMEDTQTAGMPLSKSQGIIQNNVQEKDTKLENAQKNLDSYINNHHLQGVMTVQSSIRGIEINLQADFLYEPGRADLKESSFKTLDAIAGYINALPNQISIEGHTDNVPIGNAAFTSNWELSAARAVGVLHYFESKNIADQRLQFTGFGETRPLFPNDTAAHRQANRRVDIVILKNN